MEPISAGLAVYGLGKAAVQAYDGNYTGAAAGLIGGEIADAAGVGFEHSAYGAAKDAQTTYRGTTYSGRGRPRDTDYTASGKLRRE